MMESNRIWRGLEQELGADIEWIQGGNLALAATEERVAPLRAVARHGARVRPGHAPREPGRDPGAPARHGADAGSAVSTPRATATRSRARRPRRSPTRPSSTARASTRAARSRASRPRAAGSAACGPRAARSRARTVVCAAGAWSARVLRPLGLRLPQRWVRATVARTGSGSAAHARGRLGPGGVVPPAPGRHAQHRRRRRGRPRHHAPVVPPRAAVLPELLEEPEALPVPPRPAAAARPRRPAARGRGAPAAAHVGSAPRPEPQPGEGAAEPRASSARLYPSLGELAVTRSWAGYIDATPDAIPVVGEAGPAGLVLATGFTGHGFAMGPIVGRLVAELVTDGRPSLDLRPFRFSRFAEGAVGRAAERALTAAPGDDAGLRRRHV